MKGGHLARRITASNPTPTLGVIHFRNTCARFYCRSCGGLKRVTGVDGVGLQLECGCRRTLDGRELVEQEGIAA
jgi:hypothetical protein